MKLFDALINDIEKAAQGLASKIDSLPDDDMKIEALNRARAALHNVSPFKQEPIDAVYWVPGETINPNDYNPNVVLKPEMTLLETSIWVDHYTQPIVTHDDDGVYCIVDGEHRHLVGTSSSKITRRLGGYLPITITNTSNREELMAATVRHNRARGVHKLDGMTDIVLSMLSDGWTEHEVAKALGMDADEILRLKQVSCAAEAYKRPMYKRAWVVDNGQDEIDAP